MKEERKRKNWLSRLGGNENGRGMAASVAPYLKRMERVEHALTIDDGMPLGLKQLLIREIPRLREDLSAEGEAFARVARRVHELALVSFRYGPRLFDSEAIAQLRVLDLEMTPVEIAGEPRDEEWPQQTSEASALFV